MFISGGENIQPEEIEAKILQSDLVRQVFVLPISDKEFGQRPVAVVEFKEIFNQSAVKICKNFYTGGWNVLNSPLPIIHCRRIWSAVQLRFHGKCWQIGWQSN
ncbi:2-succinylbenzoate--CoA ligase [Aggregatibacter aphrophilus]|uniref:2-succinylbenzoate--CoA ligase n=1 Tax=Aggregatibacter aphrophilus TaxID=732 RepID=A0A336N9U9_AGGAP|nr:2-succinylbenzoate--CoA ligase [Aggregatibacter aphrophilus]